MLEITFCQVFAFITAAWILARVYFARKNRRVDWKRESLLLTVYVCIVVISRIVYFPWRLVDGHIGVLRFDAGRIFPLWINTKPLTCVIQRYGGWKLNTFGNIAMFIPVGICWPLCFQKLNNVPKVVLAGFAYSLLIELSQFLFYQRSSDVDDLILNTAGTLIGALLYFAITALIRRARRGKI